MSRRRDPKRALPERASILDYEQRRAAVVCDKCSAPLGTATLFVGGPADGELNIRRPTRYEQREETVNGIPSIVKLYQGSIQRDEARRVWNLRCGVCNRPDIRVSFERVRAHLLSDTPSNPRPYLAV